MQIRRKEGKNTAELTNDSIFVPNVSLGRFVLGSDIGPYLKNVSYAYEENPDKEKGYGYDSFFFNKLNLEVWTNSKGIIESIRSDYACYWNNVNIIGLRYEKFKMIYKLEPDTEDKCYFPNGTSQHVYDFDSKGVQLWVRYGVIRTVIVSKLIDD